MAENDNNPAQLDNANTSAAETTASAAPSKETTSAVSKKTTKKKVKKKAKKKSAKKKAAKKTSKKTSKKKKTKRKSSVAGKGKKLVIVESPAKAKTINKYLGSTYVVKASVGHVRDLPKSKMGIDFDNGFALQYMTIRGKKEVMDELRRYSRGAKQVFLATDPDREGEAIAWHLGEALDLDPETTHRVTFNEITKDAIKRSFDHPSSITKSTVDAYQARRALDRIVGYSISPLLWRKIAKGLSAGRVQSVAQRLICEREEEIEKFEPEEYWTICSYLTTDEDAGKLTDQDRTAFQNKLKILHNEVEAPTSEEGEKLPKPELRDEFVRFDFKKWKGEDPQLPNEASANKVLNHIADKRFKITTVETKDRRDKPKAPFITSTLQQAASSKLGFNARRTMRIAQRLYEGVELGDEGATALITYMRTDSVHLSDFAISDARSVVEGQYGEKYLPEKPVLYKTSSKAQAAHEAIRPTEALRTPDSVSAYLSSEELKLYTLIWERSIACQMVPAVYEITTVEVEAGEALFRVTGRRLRFDGHTVLSGVKKSDKEQLLPKYEEGQVLKNEATKADQHFTQPPPRFTEASLVRTLEKLGIGRPSTYASIISTLADRGYVRNENRRFFATELGRIVNDMVVGNFSRIVDSDFTAKMESQLDKIEEGRLDWVDVMDNFYALFKDEMEEAEKKIEKIKGTPATDANGDPVACPLCSKDMVVRWSTNGKFFGCSDFPDCKGTLPLDEDGNPIFLSKEDIECPECGEDMVVRMGKRGPFLGCSTFPKCRGTRAIEATKSEEEKQAEEKFAGVRCNKCASPMAVRVARGRPFLGCTAYPECRNAISLKKAEAALEIGDLKIDQEERKRQLAEIERLRKQQENIRMKVS